MADRRRRRQRQPDNSDEAEEDKMELDINGIYIKKIKK